MIEQLRYVFGDKWSFKILSTITAGISNKESLNEEFHSLYDSNLSLCKRTKYARTRSGDLKYWQQQFINSDDLLFICLVFFTWATPKVIIKLQNQIQDILTQLSESDIILISSGLKKQQCVTSYENYKSEKFSHNHYH